jgi:hypothetical protein
MERLVVGARLVTGNRGDLGTSLIEVMVALLLIAMGVLGVATLFVSSTNVNAAAADLGSLSSKATARMESIRAEAFYNLTPGGSLTTSVSGYSDVSDPQWIVRWEIIGGGGPMATKTLHVRALAPTWAAGSPKQVDLTTLRSR